MTEQIDTIISTIFTRHFHGPPASAHEIERFETAFGFQLPDDMRRFYLKSNGAHLFEHDDSTCTILKLSELDTPEVLILGPAPRDKIDLRFRSWLAFADVRDGNYVAIELDCQRPGWQNIYDCFHESFPDEDAAIVANSFSEYLGEVLRTGCGCYWLHE